MPATNFTSLGKSSMPSIMKKRESDSAELRLRLRNEIDKLALFVSQLKMQADRVQKAADALGDEVLLDGSL